MSRLQLIQTKILDSLSPTDLSKFKYHCVEKGACFYSDSLEIFIIKKGLAKLSLIEDGEEFIIYTVLENNLTILNEVCVLEFLENSEIYSLDVKKLSEISHNEDFYKAYIDTLTDIVLLQHKILKSILFETAKARIANFLIDLALEQNLKQNGYYCVFLPFSVKVLSSFVGLKRQSTSTALNELLKDNIIRKMSQHEFIILNFEKLKGLAM